MRLKCETDKAGTYSNIYIFSLKMEKLRPWKTRKVI